MEDKNTRFEMFKSLYWDELNGLLRAIVSQDTEEPEEFDFNESASRLYSIIFDDYADLQQYIDHAGNLEPGEKRDNFQGLLAQIGCIKDNKIKTGMVH